jgi:hypothetical protein
MKRRLILAALILLAWLAFFAWQGRSISALTGA